MNACKSKNILPVTAGVRLVALFMPIQVWFLPSLGWVGLRHTASNPPTCRVPIFLLQKYNMFVYYCASSLIK